jgi:hypothetical protein
MPIHKTLMFALTVVGGVVVAAALAAQRKTRRLAAAQLQHDLQVWEDETGSFGKPDTPPAAWRLP